MITEKKIPKQTISNIISKLVKENELRKSSEFINALKQKIELYTITLFESMSHITKLAKRKTLLKKDVAVFIEISNICINFQQKTALTNASIARLGSVVNNARKSKGAISLIKLIINKEILNITERTIANFIKKQSIRTTLYARDLVE